MKAVNRPASTLRRFAPWMIVLGLAGCARAPAPAPTVVTATRAEPTATTQAATSTATLPVEVAVPTVAADNPLRFVFPTPGPVPASGWRPPLIPVPLSLRPEDHYWFVRPIAAGRVDWPHPFYRYGSTYYGLMTIHAGVDFDSPTGTPVYAAGPGVVVWTGYGLYGSDPPEEDPYGLAVAVRHDFGYRGQVLYTVYAHMSNVFVWVDQTVQTGDVIGAVGETGNVTGPHLHFEVRVGENRYRSTRNPELWYSPPTGWGVLTGRLVDRSDQFIPQGEIRIVSRETGRGWVVFSYAELIANPDDLYRENFALSDLPAGDYTLSAATATGTIGGTVSIQPGRTNFVILKDGAGLIVEPPVLSPATLVPYSSPTPSPTATLTRTPPPTETHAVSTTPTP